MSRSPLESRIAALRRRVRGLVLVHGLSRVAAGLAPMVLLACLADWTELVARRVGTTPALKGRERLTQILRKLGFKLI